MARPRGDLPLIVGLGEVVWDLFPDGNRLGGAPANVCYHAAALGNRGVLATRVGQDPLGDEALALLGQKGVDTTAVQRDPEFPTGTVKVTFRGGDPSYDIDASGAWSQVAWTPAWGALMARADVLCFGSLLQATVAGREVLARAAAAMPAGALRLCDLNLRPPFDTDQALDAALAAATVVKLSEEEAAELGRRNSVDDPLGWLLSEYGLRAVAVTRGSRGSLLRTPAGQWEHPGVPTDTSGGDPVGAGDAFTAALAHNLLREIAPPQTLAHANRHAAFVASQRGAMPELSGPEA